MSRWYNVEVVYNNQPVKKEIFSGSVSKFSKVWGCLSNWKIQGR
ncbi:DUF4974 domain-containing protein [Pedobacter steynii]